MNEKLRAELLQMVAVDQEIRHRVTKDIGNDSLIAEMVAADKKHAVRIKEIVEQYGWPGRSMVGEDGANAAWLLLQHADHDPAFQEMCLSLMQAAGEGEVSLQNRAYLTDRVRVNTGRPQVYGTQFWRDDHGMFGPRPIEDPEKVDDRRSAVGLEPLDAYRQTMNRIYEESEKTRHKSDEA